MPLTILRHANRNGRGQQLRYRRWSPLLLSIAIGVTLHHRCVQAATITWSAPFPVQTPGDIRSGGTVHFAADFNTPDGFGAGPVVINGIPFTQVGPAGIAGRFTHTFDQGPNFGAAAFPGGTGNTGLDNLLNSHSWDAGDPVTATVTLEGLSVGLPYQIQVIGAVDTRACCSMRTYEPDNGAGSFNTGTTIQRGLVQSIVGSFTADAATQTFQWRSLGDVAGNSDPSMSGLVVRLIPEPGSILLAAVGLGLMGVATRRRGLC